MELLHRWAAVVWPQDAAAALLLLCACAVLVAGLRRRRAAFARFVPALAAVAVCELWLLAAGLRGQPPAAWWPFAVVLCLLLLAQLVVGAPSPGAGEPSSWSGSARGYLVAGGALALLLLFFRLASSPGVLLAWEPSVIAGFGESLRAGRNAGAFLGATLLWDNGLVSRGDHSLLYGAPSYALLLRCGFAVWQLRVVAALLAAVAVAVMLALSRRFGGGTATAAALALALSPPLLFYGRYGTSLSGTLLGVLLAAWACWAFLDGPARQWWRGPLAALALIVATLGYSPGRLVALALLAVTVAFAAVRVDREQRRRLAGLALLVAMLAGAWAVQARRGTAGYFLNARGEQIVNMVTQPGYLESFLGRPESTGPRTLGTWIDAAWTLAARRAPELLSVLGVSFNRPLGCSDVVLWDPPRLPLFIAPLLPFLLLGLVSSLRRLGQPEHCTLVAWALLGSLPLLLTTRVDAHRMALLVVPFAVWTALGLAGMGAALHEARIGRWLLHGLGVALIGLVAWSDAVTIFPVSPRHPVLAPAIIAELEGLPGAVLIATIGEPRDVGLADLALLERQRRDPGRRARLLEDEKVRALVDGKQVDPARVRGLAAEVGDGTLLVVPSGSFTETAEALRQAGLDVAERGPEGARFWRISRPSSPPGA
ncbi:MAG TPA: hypothetical protein PKJ99_00615 [Thermoanaerobaculales bacterium]|nr:hypothetical protein [Thermoanaerobaculales bacterium]HPA79513.1 hypothetical protein [Thermoanaerobaculales bacterium]HQL30447.1 hypothetical protein [Thermoanaerobaculales bacterium]HQN97351.1 hypothetical protein [Thermoanaerobaculales bacterium]HQP43557.1 hypothetical protein [Thermoanaerobaculales bacterium]